jgi:hypothetical protein
MTQGVVNVFILARSSKCLLLRAGCLAAICIADNVASQTEPLARANLIKVTETHEHITVGQPSLEIWTSLGCAGSLPRCVIRHPI